MKFLIVDDNDKMREMIINMFSGPLNIIYECEDGSAALEKYISCKPDWVFMDILMKDVDGIQAVREIIKFYPDAKIIMVTDFNDNDLRKVASDAGAVGYVLKENLQELFEIVQQK